ncbi:Transposase, MuDR, plant [Penicillium griseofulvum]|uniref:Transposase, MuDR, plant n=1 Tax=Penicillium patulum TaxID=5078 RepID=A0A135M0C1_PENPA|nr:Transposase, MuDR, plant [Penicillium griseofulvum]KXG54660.1 Transposase, MuDR, plant [Penicillium griseofulvum]
MTEMYSGLHVGQRFCSLEEFKTVVRSISVRQHWELRVSRSNKKSVVIGCRSSATCFFRVVCRSNKSATYITSLQDSHSCRRSANSPAATPARSEASHVRFLLGEIPKLFDMKSKIRAQDVVDAVKRYHGYDISLRQAQRALTKLQPRHSEGQDEQGPDIEMSAEEQQSPEQSPESQGEGADTYGEISENRWLPEHLPPSLIDDDNVSPHETSNNHVPAPPSSSQALPPPPQGQHVPIPTQNQPSFNHNPHQMTMPQSGVEYQTAATLPVGVVGPPKDYSNRSDHDGVPQMVLTNFKIEFTCTTCGSLNQSFFPNQGNVTGASYMTHHAVPNPGNVPRHAGPTPQNGVGSSSNAVGENPAYDINASNTPTIQNAWPGGGLGVQIGPTHT